MLQSPARRPNNQATDNFSPDYITAGKEAGFGRRESDSASPVGLGRNCARSRELQDRFFCKKGGSDATLGGSRLLAAAVPAARPPKP